MNPIVLAIVSVTAIGILCAVMLSVASKIMSVPGNQLAGEIREVLPGANCGACGFAGCDGYAKALAGGGVKTNLCVPGADAVSRQLSDLLGVKFEDVVEQVATVKCRGDCDVTGKKMDYRGIATCAAAKLLFAGQTACAYGCLGLGDCAAVCPERAICIEKGIAHVDTRRCTGCGLCAKACPNRLIAVMPDVERVAVACSSKASGAVTRKACTRGCIGCGRCERECPADAVHVLDNLAVIDYDRCVNCGHCTQVCPVGCILFGDFTGASKA